MYQLRNLIHRTNVPNDPQNNTNVAEDFMLLLLHAHTIAAAKVVMMLTTTVSVLEVAKAIVVNYVCFPRNEPETCDDRVYVYAAELSVSILWHGFHDSIREGDRILHDWKYLVVIFKASSNYQRGS